MFNICQLLYRSMIKRLNIIGRDLYALNHKAARDIVPFCYDGLSVQLKTLGMLFNASCNLLKHPCLVESARMSHIIVPQIRKTICDMMNNHIGIHNYFVVCRDYNLLKQSFDDVHKELEKNIRILKAACLRLLKTSDFMKESFISVVIAVHSIMFCSIRFRNIIIEDIRYKRQLISCNKLDCVHRISEGIVGNSVVVGCYDNMSTPGFDVDCYLDEVKEYIKKKNYTKCIISFY
ncbi:hypothetical protein K6025_05050 [Ehrlichia sp. JZT12]